MTGVLLIHGFTGSREEVRALYNYLQGKGFTVSMPVLSGHEKSRRELAQATRQEWKQDVETAYIDLSKTCDKIVVVGFSMGGLLAANLYQKYPFNGLITVNTPIYYWNLKRIIPNLISNFKIYFQKYFRSATNKALRSMWQFQLLLSSTKKLFSRIGCKALVIQVQDDDTVNRKSGDYIYDRLQGEKAKIKPAKGGHLFFLSQYYQEVLEPILQFITAV